MDLTLTVPGNLLLFGEYAVLEEGGLGLACAVAPHVHARIETAAELIIEGRFGGRSIAWKPGEGRDSRELFARAASFLEAQLAARGITAADLQGRLVVDSSAFLHPDGGKRGFGSSAAATVALAVGLCTLAGLEDRDTCFDLALGAHRHGQDGRGSGYDVAASYFGGIGLFRGGNFPAFEHVDIAWMRNILLYETGTPSSTPHAVARYAAWKAEHRSQAQEFLQRSNQLVSALARSRNWSEAEPLVERLSEHAASLGRRIGVPADIEVPGPPGGLPCKAVGAGAELAVCFEGAGGPSGEGADGPADSDGSGRSSFARVDIDWEGSTWH